MADGAVDLEAVRQLIAEVLATRPLGAAEVRESSGRQQQYPTAPEYDIDYLRLEIVPRAPGALPVTIDDYGRGGVAVFVGDSPPIELTAPMNINQDPPRPCLEVIREVLDEVAAGQVDIGTWPGAELHIVGFWSEGSRETNFGFSNHYATGVTWSSASAWS